MEAKMMYSGIDLHSNNSVVAVIDEGDRLTHQRNERFRGCTRRGEEARGRAIDRDEIVRRNDGAGVVDDPIAVGDDEGL